MSIEACSTKDLFSKDGLISLMFVICMSLNREQDEIPMKMKQKRIILKNKRMLTALRRIIFFNLMISFKISEIY